MLNILVEKLKAMTCAEVALMAAEIDVSYDCLISIRYGRIKNPKLETFLKIQAYFEQ